MAANLLELKGLRCTGCGAPLPEPKKDTGFLKCEFCGVSQKAIEAKEYIESLRSEIYKWVQDMVPLGTISSTVADPVARHNIFIHNIKPKMLGKYISTKSKLSVLLSKPLLTLPFTKPEIVSSSISPKDSFENLARVQGLEPIAVVEDDKKFYSQLKSTYETYAYIANAFDLLAKETESSFLIKNFEQTATALKDNPDFVVDYQRLECVAKAYKAAELFFAGNLNGAKDLVDQAIRGLSQVAVDARTTAKANMIPGILTDVSILKTWRAFIEAGEHLVSMGQLPQDLFLPMEKYIRLVDDLRQRKKGSLRIFEPLSIHLKNILQAKAGGIKLTTLPGKGNLLVPLWDVSITYSFATGSYFWKKGKKVEDKILVAGTVPFTTQPVTDVFQVSSGFFDKISGKEKTLSTGSVLKILQHAQLTPISSNFKVIPPLITREESERFAENYLGAVTRKLKGKIRFGAAYAVRLIYAPAQIQKNDIMIPALGKLQVKFGPHLQKLLAVTL
ncbi:MAG: hypothetical protein ACW976_00475 [Candidatus Ranarchaeia archaeon]